MEAAQRRKKVLQAAVDAGSISLGPNEATASAGSKEASSVLGTPAKPSKRTRGKTTPVTNPTPTTKTPDAKAPKLKSPVKVLEFELGSQDTLPDFQSLKSDLSLASSSDDAAGQTPGDVRQVSGRHL